MNEIKVKKLNIIIETSFLNTKIVLPKNKKKVSNLLRSYLII